MPTPTPPFHHFIPTFTPTPYHHFIPTPTPEMLVSSINVISSDTGDSLFIALVLLVCVIGLLLVCVYAKLNKKL
jgi:hypothetical protein